MNMDMDMDMDMNENENMDMKNNNTDIDIDTDANINTSTDIGKEFVTKSKITVAQGERTGHHHQVEGQTTKSIEREMNSFENAIRLVHD